VNIINAEGTVLFIYHICPNLMLIHVVGFKLVRNIHIWFFRYIHFWLQYKFIVLKSYSRFFLVWTCVFTASYNCEVFFFGGRKCSLYLATCNI